MPSYDAAHYDPPAPVAQVSLRPVGTTAPPVDAFLLLDTGADITLLPRAAVERLGVTPLGGVQYDLLGFDGGRSTALAVELDVIFLQRAFRGRYLLTDHERGILGRDVLSEVVLLLNGPAAEWSEHKLSPSK
jgi:hypothetical protein